jgi:hypothetical protein
MSSVSLTSPLSAMRRSSPAKAGCRGFVETDGGEEARFEAADWVRPRQEVLTDLAVVDLNLIRSWELHQFTRGRN